MSPFHYTPSEEDEDRAIETFTRLLDKAGDGDGQHHLTLTVQGIGRGTTTRCLDFFWRNDKTFSPMADQIDFVELLAVAMTGKHRGLMVLASAEDDVRTLRGWGFEAGVPVALTATQLRPYIHLRPPTDETPTDLRIEFADAPHILK
ncbi:hypothetical protein ACFVQ4_34315 [Streptomyces laurentii]|uniref:hypothetical protein n=1 Tax=Streptomyces laurentii TaxID=39478 RepID=UPI0036CB36BA